MDAVTLIGLGFLVLMAVALAAWVSRDDTTPPGPTPPESGRYTRKRDGKRMVYR